MQKIPAVELYKGKEIFIDAKALSLDLKSYHFRVTSAAQKRESRNRKVTQISASISALGGAFETLELLDYVGASVAALGALSAYLSARRQSFTSQLAEAEKAWEAAHLLEELFRELGPLKDESVETYTSRLDGIRDQVSECSLKFKSVHRDPLNRVHAEKEFKRGSLGYLLGRQEDEERTQMGALPKDAEAAPEDTEAAPEDDEAAPEQAEDGRGIMPIHRRKDHGGTNTP